MSLLEKAIRALVTIGGKHRYLSTYCVDGNDANCRRTCMQCKAPCLCRCHGRPGLVRGVAYAVTAVWRRVAGGGRSG